MSKGPPLLVTAFANRLSKPSLRARGRSATDRASRPHSEIGPIGTSVRPAGHIGASYARHLGARPPRLSRPRADMARLAHSPQPGALLRHQPG
jgi:hypothetical protein